MLSYLHFKQELDSHAKHGQSFKKLFGCRTGYICVKYTPSGFVQVFSSMALHDVMKGGTPYMGILPEEHACAHIDQSESKSAPINVLHPLDWLYLSLLSTCSWCVVSTLAPLSCGCCRIIQVDAAHWWWLRRDPLYDCKVLWVYSNTQ